MTSSSLKNGCFNRAPYKNLMTINEVRGPHGVLVNAIPFRMSPDCQYTKSELGQKDPRCDGCSWRSQPTDTNPVT